MRGNVLVARLTGRKLTRRNLTGRKLFLSDYARLVALVLRLFLVLACALTLARDVLALPAASERGEDWAAVQAPADQIATNQIAADKIAAEQTDAPSRAVSSAVPNRFIVMYRNGAVPGDAAGRAHAAGGRLVRRHDSFGLGVVVSSPANAAATLRKLQSDPTVEFAVHDQIVTATRLLALQPAEQKPVEVLPLGAADRNAQARWQGSGKSKVSLRHGVAEGSRHGIASHPNRFRPRPRPVRPVLPVFPIRAGGGISASDASGDAYYTRTPQDWAVKQVGGYGADIAGGPAYGPWNLSMGSGVRIAVLDSGVDEQHPDLAPNLTLNMSEVDQTALPSVCDDGSPQDQQGHGSWTASLAAGAIGGSTGMMVGVAPKADLLNIKVLERMPAGAGPSGAGPSGANQAGQAAQCEAGQASGLLSWVIQGIEDAMAQRADIVSLSLGVLVDLYSGDGAGLQASFDRVAHAAAASGTVIVAAAGNDGFDLSNPRYIELPAQARDVLAVVASTNPGCLQNATPGATCQQGPVSLAYYSNYGAPLAGVAAPGGSYPEGPDAATATGQTGYVRGACSNGKPNTGDGLPADNAHSFGCFGLGHQQYVQAIGTSASAPLAAGVAALLRGAHPDWDAYTILKAMRSSATGSPATGAAGAAGTSPFNYGLVNAAGALGLLR